jgi:probable rRNA maturation factor
VPTNVLSWPSEPLQEGVAGTVPARPLPGDPDEPWSVGDVALAYDTCAREAAEQGKPLKDYVLHLVVHGALHCLGYDHDQDADAALMEALEVHALATLGVENPY